MSYWAEQCHLCLVIVVPLAFLLILLLLLSLCVFILLCFGQGIQYLVQIN